MIYIIMDNNFTRIEGDLSAYAKEKISDTLSFVKKGCEHIESFQKEEWDGAIRLFQPGQPFLTGLVAPVVKILQDLNCPFTVVDRRPVTKNNFQDLEFHKPPYYEDREYQDFAITRAIEKTRGIFHVGTGGGKTMMVVEMIGRLKVKPFLFYVLTRDLLYQAKKTLSDCFNCKIGQIGDGVVDIQDINVCTKDAVVYALNHNNKSFNIQNYKFDSCDVWDEKEVFGQSDIEKIVDVVKNCRGLYFDECVTGDSVIETECGKESFLMAMQSQRRFVKTYDGNNITYRRILNWWKKGRSQTIIIECERGKIKCTENHLILTQQGWKMAGNLTVEDVVLCVSVDAEPGFQTEKTERQESTCSDIRLKAELPNSGNLSMTPLFQKRQNVNVVAEKLFLQFTKRLKDSFELRELDVIVSILRDMINNECGASIILNLLLKKNRQLLELAWETLLSSLRTEDQKITDYAQIMDTYKKIGPIIRQVFFQDMESKSQSKITQDTGNSGPVCPQNVCQSLQSCLDYCITEDQKLLLTGCWIKLVILDLLGGFVMTEVVLRNICICTLKDIQKKKTISFEDGSANVDTNASFVKTKNVESGFYCSPSNPQIKYLEELKNTFQSSCDTNWCQITRISKGTEEEVFDIEVEGTHCFFANDILVHNCHHASSRTVQDLVLASPLAYWRYGGTATMEREDGEEIVIQGLFGRRIVSIPASYLIKHGWLVPTGVFFVPVEVRGMDFTSYSEIYQRCVSGNEDVNNFVADFSQHLAKLGKSNLILVSKISHGKLLKSKIPGAAFLTGRDTSKKRNKVIDSMRSGKLKILIATTLADEGLDIPCLDVVHMVGAGASVTRIPQRIGRVMRRSKSTGKKYGIAIYYHFCPKYLYEHGLKTKRIVRQEPALDITQTADLYELRVKVLEYMTKRESSFLE